MTRSMSALSVFLDCLHCFYHEEKSHECNIDTCEQTMHRKLIDRLVTHPARYEVCVKQQLSGAVTCSCMLLAQSVL